MSYTIPQESAEKMPHACLLKLRSVYPSLKSAEHKAADYLIKEPESIGSLNIVEYAEKAGCSEATIHRLARRIGYEGYHEMREDFASLSVAENHSRYLDYAGIREGIPPEAVLDRVIESSIAALQDTRTIIDMDEYRKALDFIVSANTILFCGLGDAGTVASEAYMRFLRAGLRCQVAADPDLQLIMASKLSQDDVLIAISHTGRSKPILDTIKQAASCKARVVAVTNSPSSQLAKKSDALLLTAVFTTLPNGEVISKRIAELSILESLYINYILAKGSEAVSKVEESDQAVMGNKV